MQNSLQKRQIPRRGRSINSCLLVLGAPREDIFAPQTNGQRCHWWGYRSGISIYQRYTRDELRTWADNLYRAAALQCHPDVGGNDRDMARVNAAYDQIKKILNKVKIR